ncbi:hypothetical protein HYW87_01805 [Candidatus Roizmanbacteria bacterium]|nr:hypothetical protein [Candidatus Roizmanbacteria bacterium]
MIPASAFVQKVETEYLKKVADLLRSGDIDFQTAKNSAKELLTYLPLASYEDMHDKLKKFTDSYPQLKKVFITFLKLLEEEKTSNVLDKMRNLMGASKIEESLKLVQK